MRSVVHAPTCATGARAERRGPCDCGSTQSVPFRIGMHGGTAVDESGRRLVEIEVDSPMTTADAVQLSIALQDLTRIEGQRWAAADAKKRQAIPTIARTGSFSVSDEASTACGHQHAGPEAGGICVGCPCEERPS